MLFDSQTWNMGSALNHMFWQDEIKGALLRAISDVDRLKILMSTIQQAKSIPDIMKECNIPRTSAYRYVGELLNRRLLLISGIKLTKEGKKSNSHIWRTRHSV